MWLPLKLTDGDTPITRDWRTTSDGLAARLAERLGGATVVLVKSCRVDRSASPAKLARSGVVDAVFATIVARAACPGACSASAMRPSWPNFSEPAIDPVDAAPPSVLSRDPDDRMRRRRDDAIEARLT